MRKHVTMFCKRSVDIPRSSQRKNDDIPRALLGMPPKRGLKRPAAAAGGRPVTVCRNARPEGFVIGYYEPSQEKPFGSFSSCLIREVLRCHLQFNITSVLFLKAPEEETSRWSFASCRMGLQH